MMEDINHVITSIATRYTDTSCPQLHFEDLVAEGRFKLAEIIDKGHLSRLPNRVEFFKFFKTAVNNHIKGLVHRHRFTVKRTGHRPPPKEDRFNFNPDSHAESGKPVEISLDDPDSHLQISDSDIESFSGGGGVGDSDLLEEIEQILSPIEKLVMRQMIEPNPEALTFAMVESHMGKKPSSVKIKVRYQHMADGLGIGIDQFTKIQESIKTKVSEFMQQSQASPDAIKYNVAISQLSELFGVQIPRSIDKLVIRRLLTIAARDQFEKVNADVREMLATVGAKAPDAKGSILSCYGVLYQRGHKICSTCGMLESCKTEAANVGLGEITLSPKLLGTKQTRIPILVARQQPKLQEEQSSIPAPDISSIKDDGAPLSSERDDEIFNFLSENFRQVKYANEPYFRHKELPPSKKVKYIFWFHRVSGEPMQLRFCNPPATIIGRLEKRKNGYYLPSATPAKDAAELINLHATATFK